MTAGTPATYGYAMDARPFSLLALLLTAAGSAPAQEAPSSDAAGRAFQQAQSLCQADAGRLWGASLCGPMMLVDPATRRVVASEADAAGALQAQGGLFVGQLPPGATMANTAVEWSGTRWTQLLWPLPEDAGLRAILMAHEMFHRVQPTLPIMSLPAGENAHLDTLEGRYTLQLEWRALAAALQASHPSNRDAAIMDALVFRAERFRRYPSAMQEEAALELNEGLAEYTGVMVGGATPEARILAALHDLRAHVDDRSFVRSFAYATGPAYGLLLNETAPGWRDRLAQNPRDLGTQLREAMGADLPSDADAVPAAAARWGGKALRDAEVTREQQRLADLDRLRARFVVGPVLRLDLRSMRIQFDPNDLQPLEGVGTVYPKMRLTDEWGRLEVTGGAVMRSDWKAVIVEAPHDARSLIQGHGWSLSLAPGWSISAGPRPGDYVLAPPR